MSGAPNTSLRSGTAGGRGTGAGRLVVVGAMVAGGVTPVLPVLVKSVEPRTVVAVLGGAGALAMLRAACGHRRLPAAFIVDRGEFRAPPKVQFSYFAAVWALWLGAAAAVPSNPGMPRPASVSDWAGVVLLAAMAALVVCFAAVVIVAGLAGRPHLRLTPAGVYYADLAFERFVPWQALRPDAAVTADDFMLTAQLDRPDLVRRRGLRSGSPRLKFSVGYVQIHPSYAAAAISFYIQHPEQRLTIGTPDGYALLGADVQDAQ